MMVSPHDATLFSVMLVVPMRIPTLTAAAITAARRRRRSGDHEPATGGRGASPARASAPPGSARALVRLDRVLHESQLTDSAPLRLDRRIQATAAATPRPTSAPSRMNRLFDRG